VHKLVHQENKANSLVQNIDVQNILNNEHGMKVKVDSLPSSNFLNIPLA
jgi:hypothetical protein